MGGGRVQSNPGYHDEENETFKKGPGGVVTGVVGPREFQNTEDSDIETRVSERTWIVLEC